MFWQVGQTVSELHDFYFIETPLLEQAEVFESSAGSSAEEFKKQLYFLKSRDGERLTLRFNSYVPILRSYLEHGLA